MFEVNHSGKLLVFMLSRKQTLHRQTSTQRLPWPLTDTTHQVGQMSSVSLWWDLSLDVLLYTVKQTVVSHFVLWMWHDQNISLIPLSCPVKHNSEEGLFYPCLHLQYSLPMSVVFVFFQEGAGWDGGWGNRTGLDCTVSAGDLKEHCQNNLTYPHQNQLPANLIFFFSCKYCTGGTFPAAPRFQESDFSQRATHTHKNGVEMHFECDFLPFWIQTWSLSQPWYWDLQIINGCHLIVSRMVNKLCTVIWWHVFCLIQRNFESVTWNSV